MNSNDLIKKVKEAEDIIYSYLPVSGENDEYIIDAMKYSVKAGGKRIRPILMREFYRAFSEDSRESDLLHRFMCAIELIHSYSLCHDDLPAMDNDRLRRGKPSTWAEYGEAYGILAGDALLNYAYEVILDGMTDCDAKQTQRGIKALKILARKSGAYGMVGGQSLDVYSDKNNDIELDMDQIEYIYRNKTSALLEASACCGAILGGAKDEQLSTVNDIMYNVGMAFQIRDDILDIVSTADILGKPIGSDERNGKKTYALLKGVSLAQQDVEDYTRKALNMLDEILPGCVDIKEMISMMAGRNK